MYVNTCLILSDTCFTHNNSLFQVNEIVLTQFPDSYVTIENTNITGEVANTSLVSDVVVLPAKTIKYYEIMLTVLFYVLP